MKKILLLLMTLGLMIMPVTAATWVAADRVSPVGAKIVEKNGLPKTLSFKVVNGVADNSNAISTNVIYVSSTDLAYTGNDSEVAAVITNEIGHIINGQTTKTKIRNMAKSAIKSKLSADNIISTAADSEYITNKTSLNDDKAADITGSDLMIQAGYNPLAMVVVITKMPGSSFEILQGKPSNSERAMSVYDYLIYNYPQKVKAGYGCKEYTAFLTYADPIVKERNSNSKKLAKFNKEQAKNKATRTKNLAQYKSTGMSSWDTTYEILKVLSEGN